MTRNQFLFNSAICFIAGMACAGFGIHNYYAIAVGISVGFSWGICEVAWKAWR